MSGLEPGGAWYADPYGKGAERYHDGHKWTQEVRGTPGTVVPDRRPRIVTHDPARPRPVEERPVGAPAWMVWVGYVGAILFPLLGIIMGILIAVRPDKQARWQGARILVLSVAIIAVGTLVALSRKHAS